MPADRTEKAVTVLPKILDQHNTELLDQWMATQRASLRGKVDDAELAAQSKRFVTSLRQGSANGKIGDITGADWAPAREILEEVSRTLAIKGSTPTETANFVFSLKEPLFNLLRREVGKDAQVLADETWAATVLLDKLGLYTIEVYLKSREEIIARQSMELLELSTPVVELWEGVLALPIIGTLDSGRTQVVMENLLQSIVTSGAEIAIIDITGVPTVDTLVAQHLIKTVAAARLMGADCIISGIRPQIAQTIVHLGVELDVISKASLADAFALALRRVGKMVTERSSAKNGKAVAKEAE